MDQNTLVLVRRALAAPKEPTPEIVFCSACQDLALGRVDGTPLCLSCMLSRLERPEALEGGPC